MNKQRIRICGTDFDDTLHGTVADDTLSQPKPWILFAFTLAHYMRAGQVQAAFDRYQPCRCRPPYDIDIDIREFSHDWKLAR